MTIDAVLTWVDGSDPDFQEAKAAHAGFTPPPPLEKWRRKSQYTGVNEARENPAVSAAQTEGRFRNMDELRYALRAIEAHAPWIGTIFLVTNGQVPGWLNRDHPRLRLIRHDEIFADPDCLPSFNSNAIELHLHRIPGLSEEFIYFNDDFFLGRPVTPEDFRLPDGRHRLFVEAERTLPLKMVDRSLTGHMWAYNHSLIEERFGNARKKNIRRFQFAHTPQIYSRSLLIEMQALWREECALTARHRFRTPFDCAMRILYTAYVAEGGLGGLGLGTPVTRGEVTPLDDSDYVFVKLGDDRTPYIEDIARVLQLRPRFFCVNDEIRSEPGPEAAGREAALKEMFARFLESYFPVPSAFEADRPAGKGAEKMAGKIAEPEAAETAHSVQRLVLLGITPHSGPNSGPRLEVQDGSRKGPDEGWQRLEPGRALSPGARLRLARTEGAKTEGETEVALHLRLETGDEALYPERGFAPDHQRRWIVRLQPGQNLPVRAAIAGWQADLALLAGLESMAAPALAAPRPLPMAQFLWADRQIRSGRIGDGERVDGDLAEATGRALERALLGGVSVAWVCHRLVLLALQEGRTDALRDHALTAIAAEASSGPVLLDLAQRLGAQGHKAAALALADALADVLAGDRDLQRAVMALRLQLAGPGGISAAALARLIGPGSAAPGPQEVALWAEIALQRGTLSERAEALADITGLIDRLAAQKAQPGDPVLTAALLVRFRLLSRQAERLQAIFDLRRLLSADADTLEILTPRLLAVAAEEARAGNPLGETLLLEGVRMACPWLAAVELAWASARLRQGRITPDVEEALARAPGADPASRMQMIRALVGLGRGAEAGRLMAALLRDLGRDRGRMSDLLDLTRDLAREGRRNEALDLLDVIRGFWPDEGELHVNWADQALTAGRSDAAVLQALDAALQGGADPFWTGYHRLRAFGALGLRDAIAPLAAELARSEGQTEALLRLGSDWRQAGATEAALALHEGLRRAQPGHGPVAMAWADLALGQNQSGVAVQEALDTALAQALAGRGDVYWTRYHRLRLFLAQANAAGAAAECRILAATGSDAAPFLHLIGQADHLPDETRDALETILTDSELSDTAPEAGEWGAEDMAGATAHGRSRAG